MAGPEEKLRCGHVGKERGSELENGPYIGIGMRLSTKMSLNITRWWAHHHAGTEELR